MKHNSLSDWLGWLEKNHPKEIDLGLERIQQVAARMHLLKPAAKVITVAGTNGKGSCATAITALLNASGASAGLYTSPHLLNYNERIQINAQPVSDELICSAFEKIYQAANEISLTYFEYGTLAALEIFRNAQLDYWVLEVGLGGRLDAVNILDADLALITSIAIDHEAWLGNTREQIALEKAGILREQQVFVCADPEPPQSLLMRAQALNTRAYFINRDFSFELASNANKKNWQWQGVDSTGKKWHSAMSAAPQLPLPSMAAAIQTIFLLGIDLSWASISQTLNQLRMPGRFQTYHYANRQFILDVAHNPAATAFFAQRVQHEIEKSPTQKIHALVAMMSDKDCSESLSNLIGVVDDWYLLDLTSNTRAASSNDLAIILKSAHQYVVAQGLVEPLLKQIINQSTQEDIILVFGSFFTLADVLTFFEKNQ